MLSMQRQFAAGIAVMAGTGALAGAVTRHRGRKERARRFATHTRADGSQVEYLLHVPEGARGAVLFDNGLGMPHEYWDWVCRALPEDMAYLRFNRPGYGLTEPVDSYDLPQHFALLDELRRDHLGELPLTLVGHSMGGYLLAAYLAFRARATEGVQRLVMVDATNVEQLRAKRGEENDQWTRQMLLMEQVYSSLGISLVLTAMNRQGTFVPDVNRSVRAFMVEPRLWRTAYREYTTALAHPNIDAEAITVPLDVLTAQDNQGSNSEHLDAQAEFLKYAASARHQVIEGSDHESLLSFRYHAELLARCIADPDFSIEAKVGR